jgi:hypothetical protein
MNHDLPPRARLAHVLQSLTTTLPGQMIGLLDAPRFAEGAGALGRLADPARAREAADAMTEEEAAWMADRLLERWARIAPVVLEPAVFVIAPAEVWLADRPARVPVSLSTIGVDDDWEAVWTGSVIPGPPGKTSVLSAPPPDGDAPVDAVVRARVRARANGQRCVLVAEARVRLRRPKVTVSDDGLRLVVTDHAGRPAVGVRVEIGEQMVTSGPGGLVELSRAPSPGATVRVEGITVGRAR